MSRTHRPDQLLGCFRVPPLRSFNKREIVLSVASIFVASKCLGEMSGCPIVFAATVVRKAQRDMCGCKAGIAFEGFFVRGPGLALLAFFVKGHAFYISLFSAGRNLGIRNGARCRFEVGIAINRRIRAVLNKLAPLFALERYG